MAESLLEEAANRDVDLLAQGRKRKLYYDYYMGIIDFVERELKRRKLKFCKHETMSGTAFWLEE